MESLNIIFTGPNQVETRHEPVGAPGPNEIQVRAIKSLISTGTEGICLAGKFDPGSHWDQWVKYPFPPGYSLVGEVVAVGPDVGAYQPGDRVATRANHCQVVNVGVGPGSRVVKIPEGVSDEEATWFGLANIVQNGVRRAQHALGDNVVVIGLGLLGQLVVQYTRLLGAREVIAVDVADRRLAMAQAHGATTALPLPVESVREQVLRLTGGEGAEVVYDVTGHPAVLPHALGLARRFGTLLLLGDAPSPTSQHLTPDLIRKGLRIVGSHDMDPPPADTDHARWSHPRMSELFFTYLKRGDMRVADLITHRYSPTEAPEAYRMLREERATAMGVIFDWKRF